MTAPSSAAPAATHITVLLPCLNEAGTVGQCVRDALMWVQRRGLDGEVLVIDNASTDDSALAAIEAGAVVVREPDVGYGAAIRAGIYASRGRVVVMADADGTYDLRNLDAFYDPIAAGEAHVVVGDRFTEPVSPLAMDLLHRLGNYALSALTRAVSHLPVNDVHCGLRSFARHTMTDLPAWSTGMEFATHMLVHAHHRRYDITQCATRLGPPTPGRRSKLRPLRDGLRHMAAVARLRRSSVRVWH